MAEVERITLKFDGGLASTGKLHFYEFGRSQYAFARFIATIEHFRRTGFVAEHIGRSTYVDIIVSTPEEGSFLETILVPAVVKTGAEFLKSKLFSLISYLWHVISPRREKTDDAIRALAEIRMVEETQSTQRERERTEQLRILKDIGDGHRANTDKAFDLVKWAMTTSNRAVGRLDIPQSEFLEMREELEAEQEQIKQFREDESELRHLDEQTLNRLTSRVRPMIPEMVLPLRRSAEKMYLAQSTTARPYLFLNKGIAASLVEKTSEAEISETAGRVRGYDRDAGVGKFSSPELHRVLNFVVPLHDRERLLDAILEAMRRDLVVLRVRKILDQSGMPTSLILVDVLL